ncbi:N-acetylglucosamine-6-phosphate deacetylase [Paenibacillus sp. IHBB 10380]|uniref:N-acetylglucosamine-6-phosphate deacetylase n=1 Tax=Paenibacillus sp. IHBB 10380 TaxID=1566358 RepID=UPI0005CFAA14|nr:N-acetylglucosamine-6-phosphate deacetylase [Paenibacillus sp. IHBB 10380]AJS57389.1 N-acetylglucosamine-6-phosphate deacetylase [Paenibacillus sp. IHBB 10380]
MSNDAVPQLIYGKLLTPHGFIDHGVLALEGENIVYAGEAQWLPSRYMDGAVKVEAVDQYIIPGFIDVHVHGGYGQDFMDAGQEELDTITKFHCSQGTTTMLATTMTAPKQAIDKVLEEVNTYQKRGMPYAQLSGVHLEGPFVNPKWCGAQNPEHMIPANLSWLNEWESKYPGLIKQVTLAPEGEGALEAILWLRKHNITAALGHTDATYDEVKAAVEMGLNQCVHCFNAMTPLHHRNPGAVGAILSDERIRAEIIADGVHVHPAVVTILARLKQNNNLILITDAMSATGLCDGEYMLGDLPVIVHEGIATLRDNEGALAGSTLTMIKGYRYLIHNVGLTLEEASQVASLNPAISLGIAQRTGTLEVGKQGDVLLLDKDLELQGVWVKGKKIS